MNVIGAAELGQTVDCKIPGCTGETNVTRGRFAYLCDEHRMIAAAKAGPGPSAPAGSFGAKVKELDRAAKLADRARADAVKQTEKALEAKQEADAREAEFRQLARDLMGPEFDPESNGQG